MVYTFKLDLHPTQQIVYNDPHKHKVIAAGKGWGKTHSVTKYAAALAMTKPGSCGAVIAPYAKQAFYDFNIIRKLIPANQIEKVSERWLIIYLKNGSEITMFSAENPEAARGYAWDWVIVDEAAFCDPAIFPIIDSQVGKRNGIAWYISTPNGKGQFWDLYCQENKDPENYKSFHFTTYDNPHYPVKEIERMKKNMPEFVFRQEVCHLPQTPLQLYDGKTITIMDSTVGDTLCYKDDSGNVLPCEILAKRSTGEKEIVVATLENGVIQKASIGHNLVTSNGKTKIENAEDVEIVFPNRYSINPSEALARLLAYCTGDGNVIVRHYKYKSISGEVRKYPYYQVSFYSISKEDLIRIADDLVLTGICEKRPNINIRKTAEHLEDNWQIQITWKAAQRFLKTGVPIGKKVCTDFDIPEWIKNGTNNVKREYIAALWGAEGSTPTTRKENKQDRSTKTLTLSMNKHNPLSFTKYFESLSKLHQDVGIKTTLTQKAKDNYIIYKIYISPEKRNTLKFLQDIGYRYCKRKEILAFEWSQYYQAFFFLATHRGDRAKELRKEGLSYSKIGLNLGCSLQQASNLVNLPQKESGRGFPQFDGWISERKKQSGSLFIKIYTKTIEIAQDVYNITVSSPDHSYLLANGINNYNCAEFIEGGVVFPHLADIMTSEPRDPEAGHTYTIGADIASTNDFTVIKVFDDADNYEVSHERLTNKEWAYIKQAIYTTCKYWNNATLIIDKTGVGAPVVEDLEKMDRAYPGAQKMGYLTVVPVIFSSVSKPQLYTNYIMMHENRTIHLLNEPVTKQEHEDFTAKRSQENSGYMKYSAPKGRNDDTVSASALAAWGLSQNMGSAVIGTMEVTGTITDNPAEIKYEQQEPVSAWGDDDWDPTGGMGVARGHNKVVLKGL